MVLQASSLNLLSTKMEWLVLETLRYLIGGRVEGKELGVAAALPSLLIEAVQVLGVAEAQQALHAGVRRQRPQVEVRGGERGAAGLVT